jgi:serine/threonine-protein kinase
MGTPEYISPEQASAQRVDGRSDLYSLGIATYEVITGKVPFSGATPQLIVAHAQNAPPPPSSVDPSQPHELDVVMARILAKRPDQRFGSGANFIEALRIVARKHSVATATPAQLAALVQPRDSSAGQATLSLGRGQTPRGPAAVPPIAPKSASPPAVPARPAPPPRATAPRRAPPPAPFPDAETVVRSPARPPVRPPDLVAGPGGERRVPWAIAAPLLGGALVLAFLFLLSRIGSAGQPPAPTAVATLRPPPATLIGTLTPSPTPLPTNTVTAEPTATLQPTAEPPTPRPVRTPAQEPIVPPTEPPVEPPTEPPPTEPPPTDTPGIIVFTPPPIDTQEPEPTAEPPTEPPTEPPPTEPPLDVPTELTIESTTTGSVFSPTPTFEPTPTLEPTAAAPTEATAPPDETPGTTAAPLYMVPVD